LKKSKKNKVFENWFLIFISIAILEVFPRAFLCDLFSNSLFSHTWAIISILSIRI